MKTRHLFLVSFLIVAMSMLTGWRSHRHYKKHKTATPIAETAKPKTLDLSLPLKIEDKFEANSSHAKSDLQIEKTKKNFRPVELDTHTIMSIEPEGEKIKSVDGAGISLNLK